MTTETSEMPEFSATPTHKVAPASPPGHEAAASVPQIPQTTADELEWENLRAGYEFHLLRYVHSPLYQAPLQYPDTIIDLGCGTSRWPKDMLAHFPTAQIVGFDSKAPPSATLSGSERLHFRQGDFLKPLPFADNSFAYVHVQFVTAHIPIERWLRVLHECIRIARPGGWIEVQDLGLPRISHPIVWLWLRQVGRLHHVELFPGFALAKWLNMAGGANVELREYRLIRDSNQATSARLMIRDGIVLVEMFRNAVVAHQIASAAEFERELGLMKQNLFRTGREDALQLYTGLCQKPQ